MRMDSTLQFPIDIARYYRRLGAPARIEQPVGAWSRVAATIQIA
jgi:hypothetical protein